MQLPSCQVLTLRKDDTHNLFEEFSVYTISCVHVVFIGLRKFMFSCGRWSSSNASKGREGGFHFIVDYVFSVEPPTHPTNWWQHPFFFSPTPKPRMSLYRIVFRAFTPPKAGGVKSPIYKERKKTIILIPSESMLCSIFKWAFLLFEKKWPYFGIWFLIN